MNILSFDIGNTNVKTEVWNEEGPLFHYVSDNVPYPKISELIDKYHINESIVSSVREDVIEVCAGLEKLLKVKPLLFDNEEIKRYRQKNLYEGKIGPDRVAAYLGAEKLFPSTSKLIVDLGTAITTDVVNKNGEFCGGNITLGMRGRLKGLKSFTALLPDVGIKEYDLLPFGKNTRSAIISGVVNGILGEILFAFQRAKYVFKAEMCILTGGDAEMFLPLLRKEGLKCEFDSSLVGRGLASHLQKFSLN